VLPILCLPDRLGRRQLLQVRVADARRIQALLQTGGVRERVFLAAHGAPGPDVDEQVDARGLEPLRKGFGIEPVRPDREEPLDHATSSASSGGPPYLLREVRSLPKRAPWPPVRRSSTPSWEITAPSSSMWPT